MQHLVQWCLCQADKPPDTRCKSHAGKWQAGSVDHRTDIWGCLPAWSSPNSWVKVASPSFSACDLISIPRCCDAPGALSSSVRYARRFS